MKYVGQTGRYFNQRYKEHYRDLEQGINSLIVPRTYYIMVTWWNELKIF
jgi:hypothetical protein